MDVEAEHHGHLVLEQVDGDEEAVDVDHEQGEIVVVEIMNEDELVDVLVEVYQELDG